MWPESSLTPMPVKFYCQRVWMKKNNKTTITTKQWKIKCSYKYKTPNLTWLTKAWYCPNLSDHIHRGSQLFQSKCVHQLERVSIGAGIWKVELYLKVLQKKINKVCKTFVNVFIYFFSSLQHLHSTCFYWLVYSAVCAQSVKGHCSIMLSLWARNCVKFTLLSDMIWILD